MNNEMPSNSVNSVNSVNSEINYTTNMNFTDLPKIKTNNLTLQKMTFLYNALENGWQLSKNNEKYIFIKKHEDKQEIYLEDYLEKFVIENLV